MQIEIIFVLCWLFSRFRKNLTIKQNHIKRAAQRTQKKFRRNKQNVTQPDKNNENEMHAFISREEKEDSIDVIELIENGSVDKMGSEPTLSLQCKDDDSSTYTVVEINVAY